MILHTLENTYAEGCNYHQFVQRGSRGLLEATALAGPELTLREYLAVELKGEAGVENDDPDEERDPDDVPASNWGDELDVLLAASDVNGCLRLMEEYVMAHDDGMRLDHVRQTMFGEWTFDSLELSPPSLREQQADVWGEAPDFPKEDWKAEVWDDATHQGYWEWVEHQRSKEAVFREGDEVAVDSKGLTGVLEDVEYRGGGKLRVTLCGHEMVLEDSQIRKL